MVHGEDCGEAVKGFLHAVPCTRGLRCWCLRTQECRSRQSVGRRHGLHSGGTHARSLARSLADALSFFSSRCVVEVFADWCGPSEAVLSTFLNCHRKMSGKKIKWYQVNTKEIKELEKYEADAKPRFLFYRDGEVMEAVEGVNAPAITRHTPYAIPGRWIAPPNPAVTPGASPVACVASLRTGLPPPPPQPPPPHVSPTYCHQPPPPRHPPAPPPPHLLQRPSPPRLPALLNAQTPHPPTHPASDL